MSLILSGISDFKFYNAKTGEEVLPIDLDDLKVDKKKDEELEILRKQTGYYFPELCPSCGQYYEGYDGHYELDGDIRCRHCVGGDDRLKLPFFAPNIPTYVDGAIKQMFTFKDSADLYNKIKSRLCEGDILVKADRYMIMSQSITKDHWWVLGYISNYDMGLLNIPEFDSEIYNEDKTVNVAKMNEWIKDKEIIKGNKDED